MRLQSLVAALASVVLAASAYAAYPPIVVQATERIDPGTGWAFTQTTVNNGAKTVERFDPSKPEASRWELVMFEGHKPTARDLEKYRKEKTGTKPKKEQSKIFDPEDLIMDGSLTVIRESADEIVYSFIPKMGEDDKAMAEVMRGRMTIRKAGPTVALIEMFNTKPVSPGMSAHITKIETTMRFAPPSPDAKALLREMHAVIKGRILLVKSLDVDSVITLTDYRYVGSK